MEVSSKLHDKKEKKVVELANELSISSKGEIIYISNCSLAKEHLKDGIRFLDISEIEVITSNILKTVIEQIIVQNDLVEIILIDNISKMLNENEISDFIKEVDIISSNNSVKILFGLDRENKDFINSLDIEKID